jgi:pimeloyl-ACP methyl ester carboxylesterase
VASTTAATIERPDGTHLAVEVAGQATDPLVLLVHGFGLTLRMWDCTLPALLDAGWRVATMDLRGHGRTEVPDSAPCDVDAVVGDVLALADHVEADELVLGGLSLGGYVTLSTWLRAPQRLLGLVLADTGPGFRREEPRDAWNASAAATAERFGVDGLRALDAMGATGRSEPAALGLDRHRGTAGLARAARELLVQHDGTVLERLPEIDLPTLVLVGDHDTPFLGAAEVLEARIPGAHRVVIPDAGHVSNVDNPAAFDDALVDFLDGI